MDSYLSFIPKFIDQAVSILWGLPLIVTLLGTGVLLTIRLHFIQFRYLWIALKLVFSRSDENSEGDISHFKALMTALAATIGTGNIVGVAIAISVGGPGAVFWLWMTALLGMSLKYGEALLAVKYRITDEWGEMAGGPMYALERGLGMKWLGVLFAVFGSIAAFGIGNMVQANSVADALYQSTHLSPWISGAIMTICISVVILGGIKRIGTVSGFLVPIMAIVYILGALVVLAVHISELPGAFLLIFQHALTPTAATGGFLGCVVSQSIRSGVSRGLFSNESGLGSAPIAAAAAKTKNPMRQALVSMTGTFIDTIVVCTMTALVIVSTGAWKIAGEDGKLLSGISLTMTAFNSGLPGFLGGYIVSFGLVLFAYSTIIGWGYYGEKCMEYLFGTKSIFPYRILWVIFVFVGATCKMGSVWAFSDMMNALMAFPNLISLIFLSGVIVAETHKYENKI